MQKEGNTIYIPSSMRNNKGRLQGGFKKLISASYCYRQSFIFEANDLA